MLGTHYDLCASCSFLLNPHIADRLSMTMSKHYTRPLTPFYLLLTHHWERFIIAVFIDEWEIPYQILSYLVNPFLSFQLS